MTVLCPSCGMYAEIVNHNNRGWRCTACWAKVPEPEPEAEEKPKRGRPAKKIEPARGKT